MIKILVTGGTGFIGSKTAEALRKAGYDVRLFRGDVKNVDDWERALPGVDIVFHFAGIRTETEKDFEVNARGTENLFAAIARLRIGSSQLSPGRSLYSHLPGGRMPKAWKVGSGRVILASSQAVYSGNKPPYVETMQGEPITVYGKSKYEAEKIALQKGRKLGIEIVILRYAAVLGSGIREKSNMSGSMARWVKAGLLGNDIVVYKDPNRIRNYVHIDDVVSANLLAVDQLPGGLYNVCGDEKIKLIDLAHMIQKATGGKYNVKVVSVELPIGDAGDQTAENKKLKKFGWKPIHTIGDAVREYVEKSPRY